ncbi:MAG: methylated-DNA--[protein]-cysteine S-methyltransferase [Oscillospiraceae bacterium]|nr:methylated-DNA--[protein]-cysteine S-methyltransferase [Oscillospiraceae bacterium]
MQKIYVYSYKFTDPVGCLGIAEKNGAVYRVLFGCTLEHLNGISFERLFNKELCSPDVEVTVGETDVLRRAATQLTEYLNGFRAAFDVPLLLNSSGFAKNVYAELLKIPAGQTRSYKEVAVAVNNPKAYRAVGMANNKNPIPIFVPCHRVVGSNGSLVGYAGGLPMKQFLIDLEKNY